MNGLFKFAPPLLAALTLAACNAGGSANMPVAPSQAAAGAHSLPQVALSEPGKPACAGSRIGRAQCDVLLQRTGVSPDVAGWGASVLEKWYNLPSLTSGSGQVVAVVDAYDNPNVASDVAAYRSYFGLPAANFYKYNQFGQQSNYPSGSVGWGVEIDLDVQMVSAACPNCTIYLVEANSSQWSDLGTAEKEAVTLGATVVSNSYSGSGGSVSDYDTPGITYLASAGDSGYGIADPAQFDSVFAAGGTELRASGSSYVESVWPYSGGGCSIESKPSWQHVKKHCKKDRVANDGSALADNAAEYDSYDYGGWITVSGTSISSPFLGGVFGLAGNSTSQDGGKTIWSLSASQQANDLHAITSGSVTRCPTKLANTYLCKAGTGQYGQYSGPGGWGSPNGVGAF